MTGPRISRRKVLLLGLGVGVAGAGSAAAAAVLSGREEVPAVVKPMPVDSPPPRGSVTLLPVSHWQDVYEQGWAFELKDSLAQTTSGDSWDHYNVSYVVDANVAIFRATGETRYLDRALTYVENVVNSAKPSTSFAQSQFRDRYRGWVSNRSDLDHPGDEIPLYESYFWRYATALLVAMKNSSKVSTDADYHARYEKLRNFAEVDVFDKWFSRGPEANIYRERTHLASHWSLIALNLAQVTTDPARVARYNQVIDNIDLHLPDVDSSLRRQMRRSPADPHAYFWSDEWGSAKRPGQDVSHGNGVMAYVTEAADNGRNWAQADMAAFSMLLTRVIWPGGRTYRAFVDGTGSDNGWFSDGFVKLGRFDAMTQKRLETHLVVNGQFAANMALNAKMLS
jgi:hypothetical protein